MSQWVQMLITILGSVIASSGFWAILQRSLDKKDVTREMLLGLAHDRIMCVGMGYINRGDWITHDEYENLNTYLYKPYAKMDGNGTAKRVMDGVNKLRLVSCPPSNYVQSVKYPCDPN